MTAKRSRQSAGLLIYRKRQNELQFFLVHPGGPFWKNKENGAWSIPKGEFTEEEPALDAAIRECEEETGYHAGGPFTELKPQRLKSGKLVYAWATPGDPDPEKIRSNYFKIEWPAGTDKWINVPEVDKAGWFHYEAAIKLLNPAQIPFLDETRALLNDIS